MAEVPFPHGWRRDAGAVRLSLMLASWTCALLFVQDIRAYAFGERTHAESSGAGWWIDPGALPEIDTKGFWEGIAAHSEVMSARWQPPVVEAQLQEDAPVGATAGRDSPSASRPAEGVAEGRTKLVGAAAGRELSGPQGESRPVVAPTAADAEPQVRIVRARPAPAPTDAKTMARLAIAARDDEGAYRVLVAALPAIEVDREHYDLLAAVLVRTQRFREAADVYAALLALDGREARLWAGYAVAKERLGDARAGAFAYRQLLATAETGSPLRQFALDALARLG